MLEHFNDAVRGFVSVSIMPENFQSWVCCTILKVNEKVFVAVCGQLLSFGIVNVTLQCSVILHTLLHKNNKLNILNYCGHQLQ